MWVVAVSSILLCRGVMQHQGLVCQGSHASLSAAMGTTNIAQGACLQAFCNSVRWPCRCTWIWIEQIYMLGMAKNLKKLLYSIARGLQVSVA
jgi:hypothetical protein